MSRETEIWRGMLVAAGLLGLALTGCGSDQAPHAESVVLTGRGGSPVIRVPPHSVPKQLVVDDLEKGTGRAARRGDSLAVRYLRFDYKTHRLLEDRWRDLPPPFVLGGGQMIVAWERALPGIREGGRRELLLPAEMTLFRAPEIYVIDVLSVIPAKSPSG